MDRMTKREYSVLMSVYYKDHPEYVRAAIESMLQQTEPPAELVLVCDGQLGEALNRVIEDYARKIVLLRLKKNQGLGMALKEGIKICRCELVARMDSDDISAKSRCALQLDYLEEHPEVDVLSGTLAEFEGAACTEAEVVNTNAVKSLKRLPEHDAELKRYMCRRNPLNHPCVMFRKSKVEAAGDIDPTIFLKTMICGFVWLDMVQHSQTFRMCCFICVLIICMHDVEDLHTQEQLWLFKGRCIGINGSPCRNFLFYDSSCRSKLNAG